MLPETLELARDAGEGRARAPCADAHRLSLSVSDEQQASGSRPPPVRRLSPRRTATSVAAAASAPCGSRSSSRSSRASSWWRCRSTCGGARSPSRSPPRTPRRLTLARYVWDAGALSDAGAALSEGVTLSPFTTIKCENPGPGTTPPERCDHVTFFEDGLSRAIRDNVQCAPSDKAGVTVSFVLEMDFRRKRTNLYVGKSTTVGRTKTKELLRCVKRAMPTPDWGTIRAPVREYKINVMATYPANESFCRRAARARRVDRAGALRDPGPRGAPLERGAGPAGRIGGARREAGRAGGAAAKQGAPAGPATPARREASSSYESATIEARSSRLGATLEPAARRKDRRGDRRGPARGDRGPRSCAGLPELVPRPLAAVRRPARGAARDRAPLRAGARRRVGAQPARAEPAVARPRLRRAGRRSGSGAGRRRHQGRLEPSPQLGLPHRRRAARVPVPASSRAEPARYPPRRGGAARARSRRARARRHLRDAAHRGQPRAAADPRRTRSSTGRPATSRARAASSSTGSRSTGRRRSGPGTPRSPGATR